MSCRFQQSDRLDSLCSQTQADALPPDQSLSSLPLESADRGLQASSAHSKPNQRARSLQNHDARSSSLTSLHRTNGTRTHYTWRASTALQAVSLRACMVVFACVLLCPPHTCCLPRRLFRLPFPSPVPAVIYCQLGIFCGDKRGCSVDGTSLQLR